MNFDDMSEDEIRAWLKTVDPDAVRTEEQEADLLLACTVITITTLRRSGASVEACARVFDDLTKPGAQLTFGHNAEGHVDFTWRVGDKPSATIETEILESTGEVLAIRRVDLADGN